MADYDPDGADPPTLMLDYGQLGAAAVRAGVRELAEAVRASRRDVGADGFARGADCPVTNAR